MRIAILVAALSVVITAALPVFAQNNEEPPCFQPEARQFDFWVGNWEVHAGGKVAGHNGLYKRIEE